MMELESSGAGTSLLDRLFATRSMQAVVQNFPTIFYLVPDTDSAYAKVVETMVRRGNGIDILSKDYVRVQNTVFSHLMWFEAPFHFTTLKEIDMYTPRSTLAMTNAAKSVMASL